MTDEIKQDPLNIEQIRQIVSIIASRRFTQPRKSSTFYRRNINSLDKGLRKKWSKQEETNDNYDEIPVNLHDATPAHKLQDVTKKYLTVLDLLNTLL